MFLFNALNCLLLIDVIFYYGLEATKQFLKVPLGNELDLNFANASDHLSFATWISFIAALTCLVVAFIADSFVGRVPIVLIGVSLFIASTLAYSFTSISNASELNKLSTVFLILYITTAGARNVLHLEQVFVQSAVPYVRKYIFFMIYSRLLVVFSFHMLATTNETAKYYEFWQARPYINTLLAAIYILALVILLLLNRVESARVHFNLWLKTIKCFWHALNSSEADDTVHRRRERAKTIGPYGKYPISPRQTARSQIRKSLVAQHDTVRKSVSGHMKRTYQARFVPDEAVDIKGSNKPKIVDTKSKESIPLPQSEDSPKVSRKKRPGHDTGQPHRKKAIRKQSSAPTSFSVKEFKKDDEGKVDDYEDIIYDYKEVTGQWIYRASPKSSPSVIEETRRLWQIKFIFLVYVIFAFSFNFVLIFILQQDTLSNRPDTYFGQLHILTYYYIYMIILYPVCEFLLIPFLKFIRILYRDLQLIGIASCLLLTALFLGLVVQLHLERDLNYVPTSFFGQVRIFNPFPTVSQISGQESGNQKIVPFRMLLLTDIPGDPDFLLTLRVDNPQANVNFSANITGSATRTVSYIITLNGLQKNSKYDPTLYTKHRNVNKCGYFLVTTVKLDGNLTFVNLDNNSRTIHNFQRPGVLVEMDPGEYRIEHAGLQFRRTVISDNIIFEAGALYSVFMYEINGRPRGTVTLVEKPVPFFYNILIAQVSLMSLAQALGTVSYFRFMFLESSPKLRCTSFTIVFFAGFIIVGICNLDIFHNLYSMTSNLTLGIISFHVLGLLITVHQASKYKYLYPHF